MAQQCDRVILFFFSSRRRHTRFDCDWSSDVCSSDLHALHKLTVALLPTLEESDIEEFLFPEGLPWKELRIDLRNNPPFFMSQNLCIFPLAEDDELRCQFDIDELRARTRLSGFFGNPISSQIVLSLDRAFSISRY